MNTETEEIKGAEMEAIFDLAVQELERTQKPLAKTQADKNRERINLQISVPRQGEAGQLIKEFQALYENEKKNIVLQVIYNISKDKLLFEPCESERFGYKIINADQHAEGLVQSVLYPDTENSGQEEIDIQKQTQDLILTTKGFMAKALSHIEGDEFNSTMLEVLDRLITVSAHLEKVLIQANRDLTQLLATEKLFKEAQLDYRNSRHSEDSLFVLSACQIILKYLAEQRGDKKARGYLQQVKECTDFISNSLKSPDKEKASLPEKIISTLEHIEKNI